MACLCPTNLLTEEKIFQTIEDNESDQSDSTDTHDEDIHLSKLIKRQALDVIQHFIHNTRENVVYLNGAKKLNYNDHKSQTPGLNRVFT